MPFWPRPATTSGSLWPGSGLCAPFSGRLSWSGITRAAPPPHPPERPNSLFHRRQARRGRLVDDPFLPTVVDGLLGPVRDGNRVPALADVADCGVEGRHRPPYH